jgi:hypothetical protein
VISNSINNAIEVQEEGFLYTEQELEQGINEQEDLDDVTDSEDDSDIEFNDDSRSNFNKDVDGDKEESDCIM